MAAFLRDAFGIEGVSIGNFENKSSIVLDGLQNVRVIRNQCKRITNYLKIQLSK